MIGPVLLAAGFAVCVLGLGCLVSGRLAPWRVSGLMAISNSLYLISDVMGGDRVMASVNAFGFALSAHSWWTGGGGDGTKRRLRSLARRFTPVRRTAPAAAS